MVIVCCVPSCKNNSFSPADVSFHKFPSDPTLINIWIHKIKRDTDTRKIKGNPKPFKVSKYTKICSAHFTKGDFSIKLERKWLNKAAVPSVFPWTRTSTKVVSENLVNRGLARTDNDYIRENGATAERTESLEINNGTLTVERYQSRSNIGDMNNTVVLVNEAVEPEVHEAPLKKSDKNTHCQECCRLNTLYTTLLINHNELLEKCTCKDRPLQRDKATNVSFTVFDEGLFRNRQENLYKNVAYAGAKFSIDMFKHNDNDISYYAGFPSYDIFKISLNILFDYQEKLHMHRKSSSGDRVHQHALDQENEYFLVLMKLRQNFGYQHLSALFNVSIGTISNLVTWWINFMYVRLASRNIWPHRDILLKHYSIDFKEQYPNVIGSLDATEFYIQTPSSLLIQSETFSHYKQDNTLKGLLAVNANGAIIFISALFTGSVSDNTLLQQSGFTKIVKSQLEKGFLLAGDTFLADKGFTCSSLLKPININIPVFKMNEVQFSVAEVRQTQHIARERVHVERAIGRLKNFKILSSTIPLTIIGNINQIWTVCCILSNFQMPLRKRVPVTECQTLL